MSASLPILPSTWTAPTSCFATTNYYYVLLGGGFFSNMYGTPTPVLTGNTPSGSCFPPSFTIDVPYVTDGGCPSGYTTACATAGPMSHGQPVSTVTCCPSVTSDVFSFMCKDNQYGCHATATPGVVWTGVMTNIGLPTPTVEPATRTPSTAEGIEAWGIKLLSVASQTSTTTSLPLTTPAPVTQAPTSLFPSSGTVPSSGLPTSSGASENSEQSSNKSELGAGAVAGISIGSVLGAALVALGALLFYRNRKKNQQDALPPVYTAAPLPKHEHELDGHDAPQFLDPQHSGPRIWELDG